MEAKGAAMVGGHVLQVMDQGCDLMFIDHGQRHSLRLMGEQVSFFPSHLFSSLLISSLSLFSLTFFLSFSDGGVDRDRI